MTTDNVAPQEREPVRASQVYRAVWRWHFYAGMLVVPFLLVLAVTGALYLFHNEIEDWWYRDLRTVAVQQAPTLAPEAIVARAESAHPGRVLKYLPPAAPDRAAVVVLRPQDSANLSVFVDPYAGKVLGAQEERGTLMWTVRQLHSLSFFGPIANGAIEIAAGWTILLVLTGLYLWWPRGRRQGVVTVRGTPGQRVFWRDLHAVAGAFAAFFILFLALTGMPWSIVWGAKVNQWANGNNFGYPSGVRVNVPMSDARLADAGKTTWSLEQARMPMSQAGAGHDHGAGHAQGHGDDAGHDHGQARADAEVAHDHGQAPPLEQARPAGAPPPIGLDAAVAAFTRLGLAPGYVVNLPTSATAVYTGSVYPNDLARQRVVHLDQYSGKPLLDMSYADYGPLGRGLEWGINVHMGQEYGRINQIVLALACLAMVLMCVGGVAMWWKRRPVGGLGIPPLPKQRAALRGVMVLMIIGGCVFPLVGASLVVMLLIDAAVQRAGAPAVTRLQ